MERKREHVDKYGLFGKDIGYSFSRGYFGNKFEQLDIQATYENFDVANIQEMRAVLSSASAKGYNVTIPYKQDIIPLLDRLDVHADNIGAVNTVKVEENGTLTGYNTDYLGFRDSLLEKIGERFFRGYGTSDYFPKTNKGLILGTGGASKAVFYAMKQLGVHCQFVSRKRKEGCLIYDDLDKELLVDQTFIINTTPVGTYPEIQASPDIPYEFLNSTHVVFDLIYNPEETTFLRRSREQDAIAINGLRMLELQAEASWKIWNS